MWGITNSKFSITFILRVLLLFILFFVIQLPSLDDQAFGKDTHLSLVSPSTQSFSNLTFPTAPVDQEIVSTSLDPKMDLMLLFIPSLSMGHLDSLLHALPTELHPDIQLGAMTLRTVSGLNKQHNLMTLATGLHEKIISGWNAYHVDEWMKEELIAAEKYVQLTGREARKSIVLPLIFKFQNDWQEKHPDVPIPLWLGERLGARHIQTLVLGNSDRLDILKRMAPVLVMDEQGQADGLVSKEILARDPLFPTGYKMDWNILREQINQAWQQKESTFTVVELGDLERLTTFWDEMQESHYKQTEAVWFSELGQWLGQLLSDYDSLKAQRNMPSVQRGRGEFVQSFMSDQESTRKQEKNLAIWIVSPWVSKEAASDGQILAPFLIWEPDQKWGILTSMTTKQSGIISNLDFLPTLLHKYGIPQPPELIGKVMQIDDKGSVTHEQLLHNWKSQLDYMFSIYEKRRSIITSFLITIISALIASTVYWWFYRDASGAKLVHILIGAILLSPMYFLWLTPLIKIIDESVWIVLLFGFGLLSSAILYKLFSPSVFMGSVCFLNSIALVWDMLQGSVWMKRSFLGYDAIIGARFYGIGNEYAGILLGSSIMAVTAFYIELQGKLSTENRLYSIKVKRFYFLASSVWYLFILYLVGAPSFGTNAGAIIAFLITIPTAQIFLFQAKLKAKHFMVIGMCFLVGLFIFITLQLGGEHTHINSLIDHLRSGNWQLLFEIIGRKWSMNMRLIKVSLWGKLFVISLITLLLFFFRVKKEQRGFNKDQVFWYSGFRSILIGAILLLLVNDSGIVAAATTTLYVTFPLIFQRLNLKS